MVTDTRPLSPHLQVYRPQITSILSILHRMSGVLLVLGSVVPVYWLSSAAAGPDAYREAVTILNHWLVKLLLLGWTLAFYYHLANGVRHLCWDVGRGFELAALEQSGKAVVAAAIILTVLTWMFA